MPLDRFLIAPYATGLQQNLKPWLILDDAFQQLNNCRAWRGRIRKRFGSYNMNMSVAQSRRQQFSRFRFTFADTDVNGNLAFTAIPTTSIRVGSLFSAGDVIFTVTTVPVVVGNAVTLSTTAPFVGTLRLDSTGPNVYQFRITGGVAVIAPVPVYFYPALPVMALPTYNGKDVNDEQLTGFDTQFAYKFSKPVGWQYLGPVPPAGGSATWTGTNHDFHNTCNWRGTSASTYLLFVVNGVIADQIKYYDGVADTWTSITPIYDSGTMFVIATAKIVIQFKNRLLLMNTTEQTDGTPTYTNFQNRIRWSKLGDPTAADSWYEDTNLVLGSFLDIPTNQAIIGAEFLRDKLIIYMESSTWELTFTNNDASPFLIQQINTVLGCESGNSIVPFDKDVLGFGSTGLHSCNGTNVTRIDYRIPNEVFNIQNNDFGPQRVSGIRDYFTQEVYFAYPSSYNAAPNANVFPNTVLVYNYETESFSTNNDSITALGYYQNEGNIFWQDISYSWQESDETWSDPSLISLFRNVVAGNQEGWTFIIDSDRNANALSLSITNISVAGSIVTLTITDHNVAVGSFIYIQNVTGTTGLPDGIYRVNTVPSTDTITIVLNGVGGTYTGGGTVGLVSKIQLISKQYNFYNKVGKKVNIPRVDFLISKTNNGRIFFDYNTSFSNVSLSQDSLNIQSSLGTNILDTNALSNYESTQDMIWRSLFPFAEGLVIQYQLYFNDALMTDPDVVWSDFELHAVVFYARPTSDLGF